MEKEILELQKENMKIKKDLHIKTQLLKRQQLQIDDINRKLQALSSAISHLQSRRA